MSNTFQRQIVTIMEEMATSVLTEMSKGVEGSATLCIEMSGSHENKGSKVIFPVVQSETRMAQLASVIELLAQEAVNKICDLALEDSAVLRLEVTRSQKEIGALKRKLELMEKELRTLQGGAAGERSLKAHSVGVQDACELRATEIELPHSAVVHLCGDAVPTVVGEDIAPLQHVSMMTEPPDVEDGIESIIIKEERLEEDLESRHLEGRLDISKEGEENEFPALIRIYKTEDRLQLSKQGIPAVAHQNCVEAKGQPMPGGPDKNWNLLSGMDGITEQLILWRGANESLFTGKRNAAVKGFEIFIKEMGLEGKVTVAFMKKKWENLKQKYKELKSLPIGRSTEGGEMTAATWKWYGAMNKVLGSGHSITPLAVGSPSAPVGTVVPFPSEERAAGSCFSPTTASTSSSTVPEAPSSSPPLKRAKKEPEWLLAIKELERREEARDVREAEWERVMMEREERREREMMEREERREREMMEREERRDREMRGREERLVRESRDRENRRTREAAAREARFLHVMDFLLKK
ncbi:uncharacterized protein LOC133107710 isoform X1 [Conger conger]|uniref:uncharacterized protein LOC133107710 isoform X1 n=2 Tax=Conger conger TaxID=82655 RepID=UPI002A5B116B|nr:uncharacterized protein LOC133107710 isoform X1 [Conger conger]